MMSADPTRSAQPLPPALTLGPRTIHVRGTAIVCLVIVAYGVITTWVMPISELAYYDPGMAYMLSSLSVFRGAPYVYIDHPGTPLEVAGTLLLAATYPLAATTPEGFIGFHLRHPAVFFALAQTCLVAGSVFTCVQTAGRAIAVEHWTHAAAAVALAALYFAVHPDSLESLAVWSHNSTCYVAGSLVSLWLLLVLRRPGGVPWRHVAGLGFATGLLTSIQLYFAAWVLGTAVALTVAAGLRSRRWLRAYWRAEVVLVTATLGFVVATLPIRESYLQFLGWVWRLTVHQGIYGGGPEGFSTTERMADNLWDLIQHAPVLFGTAGAALALLVARLWRDARQPAHDATLWASGLGLAVQLGVVLLLATKHPATRYLLPAAATLPLLVAATLRSVDPRSVVGRWLHAAVAAGVASLLGYALWSSLAHHVELAASLGQAGSATEAQLTGIATRQGVRRESLRLLWTYGTSSPCYALWFGDVYTGHAFERDIGNLCPNDGALDVWQLEVHDGNGRAPFSERGRADVLVIPSDILRQYPRTGVGWQASPSAIPSLGYGPLQFLTPAT